MLWDVKMISFEIKITMPNIAHKTANKNNNMLLIKMYGQLKDHPDHWFNSYNRRNSYNSP